MSNVFTVTLAVDLKGAGGISAGDYTVNWYLFIPWLSVDDLYNLPPAAIAYENFGVAHSWFNPVLFSDMPPGFLVSAAAKNIAISGVGTNIGDFIVEVSNNGLEIVSTIDFNNIIPGNPAAGDVRAAYDWILPNHGFYLTATVAEFGASGLPSPETVRSGFQIYDETEESVIDVEPPVVITKISGTTRYFMYPFKVGAGAPPPDSNFWTNFHACVEDV